MNDIGYISIIIGLLISSIGLYLNVRSLIKNTAARKLSNYQEIIKSHREIWKISIDNVEPYSRILQKDVDFIAKPITYQERRFVQFVLLHMTSSYNFSKQSEMMPIEQLKYDFNDFISLPIPKRIWESTKHFYNKDFVEFVDSKFDLSKLKEDKKINISRCKINFSIMKNLQSLDVWLIILFLLSLWSICSIKLQILPLLSPLFESKMNSDINDIILNLSYSYLPLYIFYIVVKKKYEKNR